MSIKLTIDGTPAGDCDEEIFELVRLYLDEGRKEVDIVRELRASGIPYAPAIVVNAKRTLDHGGGRA